MLSDFWGAKNISEKWSEFYRQKCRAGVRTKLLFWEQSMVRRISHLTHFERFLRPLRIPSTQVHFSIFPPRTCTHKQGVQPGGKIRSSSGPRCHKTVWGVLHPSKLDYFRQRNFHSISLQRLGRVRWSNTNCRAKFEKLLLTNLGWLRRKPKSAWMAYGRTDRID